MSFQYNIARWPSTERSELAARAQALKLAFLRWQCRVRQIAVRETQGRPDDAVMPAVTLTGQADPMGYVITVLSKSASHTKTPELQHLLRQTHDPAQRRDKAIAFLSENYYQRASEFSDVLTATFEPHSEGAARILRARRCRLTFEAYGQQFDLHCEATRLAANDPQFVATWWHNALFNPNLHPQTIVVAFQADWTSSTAQPPMT